VLDQFRIIRRCLRRELTVCRLIASHPRTPKLSKILLGAAVGYAAMPFDLIPDFIPVIGHLDDAVIVPGLVALALRMIPKDVIRECRARANATFG
jgi:uncharacterized membrane protein YkvA (DUF1232 family)